MFTTLYLLLLFFLVLFSWIGNVYGLSLPEGDIVPSLLSSESMRWFVRHGVDHITEAPIVTVLLVLILMSVVRSIGLSRYVARLMSERRLPVLSRRQRHASRVACSIFGVGLLLVLSGVLLPGGNLLSVTGHLAGGPLSRGWLLVVLLVVCIPGLVYGRIVGLWHTERDMLSALTTEIARCSGYFVTLIVASQLMAALRYTRLFEFVQHGDVISQLFTFLVYALPLLPYYIKYECARGHHGLLPE